MTKDQTLSRRRLLEVGGLGSLGLTLPGLLRAEARGAGGAGTSAGLAPIRSCILVFYYGGPSHIDTVRHEAEGPGGGPRRVRLDRDERAGDEGLRAPAAHRAGDGPPGDHPEHAPPDDQPQRGGVRGAVRPQPARRATSSSWATTATTRRATARS